MSLFRISLNPLLMEKRATVVRSVVMLPKTRGEEWLIPSLARKNWNAVIRM